MNTDFVFTKTGKAEEGCMDHRDKFQAKQPTAITSLKSFIVVRGNIIRRLWSRSLPDEGNIILILAQRLHDEGTFPQREMLNP